MKKYCINCGDPNASSAVKCTECGHPFKVSVATPQGRERKRGEYTDYAEIQEVPRVKSFEGCLRIQLPRYAETIGISIPSQEKDK